MSVNCIFAVKNENSNTATCTNKDVFESPDDCPLSKDFTVICLKRKAIESNPPPQKRPSTVPFNPTTANAYVSINSEQKQRIDEIRKIYEEAMYTVLKNTPPGYRRDSALARMQESRFWAIEAISKEN